MTRAGDLGTWARYGISRRPFLQFCTAMAATLALPERYAARIARALAQTRRPALVWLEFQDCAGCTESFLRASRPSVADLVLEVLSLNYVVGDDASSPAASCSTSGSTAPLRRPGPLRPRSASSGSALPCIGPRVAGRDCCASGAEPMARQDLHRPYCNQRHNSTAEREPRHRRRQRCAWRSSNGCSAPTTRSPRNSGRVSMGRACWQ
ncbi:MAG: twin-arginine translocation signal domain-containing protein [Firmicutes bacterium]|nr:twin-arginine translocation signal domain-containing protein [Bacillota bacterium]